MRGVVIALGALALAIGAVVFWPNADRLNGLSNIIDTDGAEGNPVLVIEVGGQAKGEIEIELLRDVAPNHVARIVSLAENAAYDGVVFHRVIAGFMAQTGDVQFGKRGGGTLGRAGTGGSDGADLSAEFSDISFTPGTVGMARAQHPDSANSQFFIMFADAPFLDGQYTVIGRVIAGMDVVNAIKKGDPNLNGLVSEPDYMVSVSVKVPEN